MTQTSVRWRITSEGEDYLERTGERLEWSLLEKPGPSEVREYAVGSAQMRNRLRILEHLKEHGPTLAQDLPPFQHLDYMREHGWLGRARIAEGAARRALVWLRDHEYILAIGGG